MSSSGISTKSVRNLEKPKPLRLSVGSRNARPVSLSSPLEPNTHVPASPHPHRLSTGPSSVLELMNLLDKVSTSLSNAQYDSTLPNLIDLLYAQLKLYGAQIESTYQTEVDNAFVPLRNGTVSEKLDETARLKLLHLVELRSAGWKSLHTDYYAQTLAKASDMELSSSMSGHSVDSLLSPISPPPNVLPLLAPGELVKSSGKYPKPTKIPGKNYCKDEVVIRNADSGKVMGIKGRRVHMIEELSETIISFQRVHPGARERNVQITGPSPDNIVHATQLIDETIRKNMSPVRELGLQDSTLLDSNSSCNSSQSDDSGLKLQQPEPDDCSLDFTQFRHFISFGHGRHVTIVGNDYSLVNNVVVLVVGNKHHLVGGSGPPLLSPALDVDEETPPPYLPGGTFAPISPLSPPNPLPPFSNYLMDLPPPLCDDVTVPPPLLPPAAVETRTKLSRSKSDASVKSDLINSHSSSSLLSAKLTHSYSRDFLIMCSKSPLAQKKPPELVYIELNYSEITKHPDDGKFFDAVEYLTQCELNKHKPRRLASYSATDGFSDDYDLPSNSPNNSSSKLFS